MTFFLEDTNFNTPTSFRGLTESVDMDIISFNESVYSADLTFKDIMIETMQTEASHILTEGDEGQGVGATIKKWFEKMYKFFKDLFNKVMKFFKDTFNKMFSIAHKLKNYYDKNKTTIIKTGEAEVTGLSSTQRGEPVIARGKTYIKDAVMMAMESIKMSSKKEGLSKAIETLKLSGKSNKAYKVTAGQVGDIAGKALEMTKTLQKSQESVLKELKQAQGSAKDAVARAKKGDDKELLKQRKEELTISNQRVTYANRAVSAGVKLCNALMRDAFKSAKAMVRLSKQAD